MTTIVTAAIDDDLDRCIRISALGRSDEVFVAAVEEGREASRIGRLVDDEHVVASIERIVDPLLS